jgi:SNF2 family DNA or RNA helicase
MRLRLSKDGSKLGLDDSYEYKDTIKEWGGRWDASNKLWILPATPVTMKNILENFGQAIDLENVDGKILSLIKAAYAIDLAALAKTEPTNNSLPVASKTEAWGHQAKAYNFVSKIWNAEKPSGVLLYMGMGTGKSKVAVDLIINKPIEKALIVCPKSVISVWPDQFALHAGSQEYMIWHDKKGRLDSRAKKMKDFVQLCKVKGKKAIVVINYDAVWRKTISKIIESLDFDACILDESQRAKSHNSKTSKFLGKLGKKIPYRLCLTGTPMPNSPLDVFGQFRFLDEGLYGATFTRFRNKYAIMGGPDGNWVLGPQNEEDLRDKMFNLTFKADRDVLDLPEAVHMDWPVELSEATMKLYKNLENEFYAEVDEGEITVTNALTKLLRLQQLTGGWVKVDDTEKMVRKDKGKEEALTDIIEDMEPEEPVVVFCRFRADLDVVHEVARKLRATSSELSGRINDLEKWQRGRTRVLAVQIQAGGVGIDLTRASKCVYYSVGYSLGDYEQSLARIHRPGQDNKVTYIHIKAKSTVDMKVYHALNSKQKVIESIVEGRC